MSAGKRVSGVYVNDSNEKRVMTRLDFVRKLHLRGGGKKGSSVVHWKQYRQPKQEAA